LRCLKSKFEEYHRLSKNKLMSMRFCCPNRECESSRENLQKKVVQKVVPTELGMEYN
jgi:hypothetical protein